MPRRPASSISASRVFPRALGKRAARSSSTSRPGIWASTPSAVSAISASGSRDASRSTPTQVTLPNRLSTPRAALLHLGRPTPGGLEHRGQRRLSPRSARAASSRAPCGGAAIQLGHQGIGHFPSGQLPRDPQPDRQPALVVRTKLLHQKRHAGGPPGENGPAGGLQDPLRQDVRLADRVVQLHGFGRTALGQRPFGDQRAAFGCCGADRGWGAGKSFSQGLDSLLAADVAQGHGRGGSHLGVGVGQPGDEGVDRPGVAPHAERVDHSHQQPPLELAHRLAQGLVRGRPGNRFQGYAGPRGELRVGQQGGQGGHGLRIAVDGKLLAGDRLIAGRRVRLEHLDQLALFSCAVLFVCVFVSAAGPARQGPRPSRPPGRRIVIWACWFSVYWLSCNRCNLESLPKGPRWAPSPSGRGSG